jgi:hypothetical protein
MALRDQLRDSLSDTHRGAARLTSRRDATLPSGNLIGRLLDTVRTPFHLINYAGSCIGARIIPRSRMGGTLDRVIAALQRRLERAPEADLRRACITPPRGTRSSPAT